MLVTAVAAAAAVAAHAPPTRPAVNVKLRLSLWNK